MILPQYLKKGDKIGIISTAGIVSPEEITFANDFLASNGFIVQVGKTVGKKYNTFAGDDNFRYDEFQNFIDSREINAIIFARGGYGTVRIIDRLNFNYFRFYPKWLVGFSDMTILHNHIIRNFDIPVIHGPMAKSLRTKQSGKYLIEALRGNLKKYILKSNHLNIPGTAKGNIVGGNLSILNNISGTKSDFEPSGKILFLEETSEFLYHIDRMLWGLERSKDLSKLKGIILGNFSKLKDNKFRSYGKTIYEIILEHFLKYKIPVIFDFPAGHNSKNYSLYMGMDVKITSGQKFSEIEFL